MNHGLGRHRRLAGWALLVAGMPGLIGVLVHYRAHLDYATPVLLVLTLVVLVALVGGLVVALPGALAGGLALNWFLTAPYGTFDVAGSEQLVVLAVYLAVAVAVSTVVDLAARLAADAERARAEAQALASVAGATLAEQQTLPDLLERVRTVFGMRVVALRERAPDGWQTAARTVGDEPPWDGERELRVPAGPDLELVARGPVLFAADRQVLTRFAEAAATALEGRRLAGQARAAAQLEEADRTRTALLAAVGHDLRTPLAGVKAAVSSLRQGDVVWTEQERSELLETIELSADRLQALVENLLDASRLQLGAVSVLLSQIGWDEVVARVLLGLGTEDRERIHLDLPEGLPDILADLGLLERVLANVLDNALRHAPVGTMVSVVCTTRSDLVSCDVVDHGRGVPERDRDRLFAPFQRLGDRDVGGTGLGLTVARGFAEAMHGTLTPRSTPGGGLTMRIALPRATGSPPP